MSNDIPLTPREELELLRLRKEERSMAGQLGKASLNTAGPADLRTTQQWVSLHIDKLRQELQDLRKTPVCGRCHCLHLLKDPCS